VQRLESGVAILRARDAPQFSYCVFNADMNGLTIPEVAPLATFSTPLRG
jgi:hypothetical protein